jgi:hypothetical protein
MSTLDIDKLLGQLASVKKDYSARVDDGQIRHNAQNLGGGVGQLYSRGETGEYAGLLVEGLDVLRPLVTDVVMRRVLKLVEESPAAALEVLNLVSMEQMWYAIDKWFSVATSGYVSVLDEVENSEEIDEWVTRGYHAPLACRLRLVTLAPGMPEEWAGKEFESGDDIQKQWSVIRQGPPVTYAIFYGMRCVEETNVYSADDVRGKVSEVWLIVGGTYFRVDEVEEGYEYVMYEEVAIGWRDVFDSEVEVVSGLSVSRLVSQLQKCVRYGPSAANLLIDTIISLSVAPDYHVPERQFERVSSARQLAWRSFISIVEDCGPVKDIDYLLLLTLVCSKVLGHFNGKVIYKITELLMMSLAIDKMYGWRALGEEKKVRKGKLGSKNAVMESGRGIYDLALRFVPMMQGDTDMLTRYSYKSDDRVSGEPTDYEGETPENVAIRSIDHHCCPYVILLLQACKVGMTLEDTSRYIWDTSSAYNYRYSKKKPSEDTNLYAIQKWVYSDEKVEQVLGKRNKTILLTSTPTDRDARLAFINLFGVSFGKGQKRMCYVGSVDSPLKVMKDKQWVDGKAVDVDERVVSTKGLPLPLGYEWTKEKYTISVKSGKAKVDGKVIEWYDGSSLMKQVGYEWDESEGIAQKMYRSVRTINLDLYTRILTLGEVEWSEYEMLMSNVSVGYEWKHIDADVDLVRSLLVKLQDELVEIGPVDRSGRATKGAVHSLLEGRMWGCMVLFSHLYSDVVMRGNTTFRVTRGGDYAHLMTSLQTILDRLVPREEVELEAEIVTQLWKHQQESVDRILEAYESGMYGLTEGSDVGSGKTLVALSIASNVGKTRVMVSSPALLPTWEEEVKKHTKGFRVAVQQANGSYSGDSNPNLILSTMARTRDHPPSERLELLVIDECLSVQNNKALWTAEAWRQTIFSKRLLLMSATFFRSRYDKLYYMLKMLRTGIPERKEYLDAILIETMISQQPDKGREWETIVSPIAVDSKVLAKQREILGKKLTDEAKYAEVASLLASVDVTKHIKSLLTGHKCLIYARSNDEANRWSESLDIPIYPDISKDHVIVSLSRGTYGLNDLVKYDTLITRPPEPDRLPQMKGRLDRPGQKSNKLRLVYFYLGGTIEEGGLRRLEVARQFDKHYKMPLAKYYSLALDSAK